MGKNSLMVAAEYGNDGDVIKILIDNGAKMDSNDL